MSFGEGQRVPAEQLGTEAAPGQSQPEEGGGWGAAGRRQQAGREAGRREHGQSPRGCWQWVGEGEGGEVGGPPWGERVMCVREFMKIHP